MIGMLEARLQKELPKLQPLFRLVGSVVEGTRLGNATEIDVIMSFGGWVAHLPFLKIDKWNLVRTGQVPGWMEKYFAADGGAFVFHKFKWDLLRAVSDALDSMFKSGENPPRLRCVTSNAEYRQKAQKNLKQRNSLAAMVQDPLSAVTVSQTKIGLCLQFEWQDDSWASASRAYCSVDLVPTFPIESVSVLNLTNTVNASMLSPSHPRSWWNCLSNYVRQDKKFLHSKDIQYAMISDVVLKILDYNTGNYFVRPGQPMWEIFANDRLKTVYTRIKALKTILNADISNYIVKKMLLTPEYAELDRHVRGEGTLLYHVMNRPSLRIHLESTIDYETWAAECKLAVPLKGEKPERKRARTSERKEDNVDDDTKIPRLFI